MQKKLITVALVQDGTPIFDTLKTMEKVEYWCQEASKEKAELILFPEAFIGGYPKGKDFGLTLGTRAPEGRALFRRYFDSAITQDGAEKQQLASLAKKYALELVVGVIERVESTLYCSVWFFSPKGELQAVHRKLMPTALERCVWGNADGSTMPVIKSPLGNIGAAICWENYMPLYRTHLYQQGVEIYCAPTVDEREQWQSTIRHIALEGRCFMLSACQYMTTDDLPTDLKPDETKTLINGGSCVISPLGEILAGPIYGETCLLTTEINLEQLAESRFDLDVVGHYSRPDIFQLTVDTRKKNHSVILKDDSNQEQNN